MDTLRRYKLNTNTVGVIGSFYIAWKQLSTGIVAIGFDKNTDSGNKISFNVNGSWEPNLQENGSLMIHPVFGKGGLVTGLPEPRRSIHAFPNPNSGIFYLSGEPEFLEIYDLAGKAVDFSKETNDHQTKIEMKNAYPGLYVLKTFASGKYSAQKILVRP